MTSKPAAPPDILPNLVAFAAVIPAFYVIAIIHGGPGCWIQGLNYIVAAVPFGLSITHAWRFRRVGQARHRRHSVYYFILFLMIACYAWNSVEKHNSLVAGEEQALAPVIKALKSYREDQGRYPLTLFEAGQTPSPELRFDVQYERLEPDSYELTFKHNLLRKHQYLSETGRWTDGS